MSAATKQALEQAIQAHFSDMCGAMVDSFVLQIHGSTIEDIGTGRWTALREVYGDQPVITTLGLVSYAKLSIECSISETIAEDDDDE